MKEGIKGFLENTGVGHGSKFMVNQKLLARLPAEFKEQAEQFRHLGAYLSKLPIEEIVIHDYF